MIERQQESDWRLARDHSADETAIDCDFETEGPNESLSRTIRTAVIPRLLLAYRAGKPFQLRPPAQPVQEIRAGHDDQAALTALLMRGQRDALHAHIESLLARGMPWETIALDLFTPVARHLGELWCSDSCSFSDVTLALCLLHNEMRDRSRPCDQGSIERSILLAAMPGSQHTFGLALVEDFFRRAGWIARTHHGATTRTLVEAVRREWFPVVGLSVSCAATVPGLPRLIAGLRSASRNKAIAVLVGGPYFADRPDAALAIGADATASDAREAVARAKDLTRRVSRN